MKFATAILAAASAVTASPLSRNYAQQHSRSVVTSTPISDVVVTPGFTAPTGGESYPIGSNQTAAWDTTKIDPEAKDYTGVLYLGYSDGESSNEHLDIGAYHYSIHLSAVADGIRSPPARIRLQAHGRLRELHRPVERDSGQQLLPRPYVPQFDKRF